MDGHARIPSAERRLKGLGYIAVGVEGRLGRCGERSIVGGVEDQRQGVVGDCATDPSIACGRPRPSPTDQSRRYRRLTEPDTVGRRYTGRSCRLFALGRLARLRVRRPRTTHQRDTDRRNRAPINGPSR